MKKDI
jgi:hypothetical protein